MPRTKISVEFDAGLIVIDGKIVISRRESITICTRNRGNGVGVDQVLALEYQEAVNLARVLLLELGQTSRDNGKDWEIEYGHCKVAA